MAADAADGAPRDDRPARDAEEAFRVQFALQGVQRAFHQVAFPRFGEQVVRLFLGEESGDVLRPDGDDAVTHIHDETFPVLLPGGSGHGREQFLDVDPGGGRALEPLPAAAHRAPERILADGLEQVVDAARLEGLERVGVVGGGHDDLGVHGHLAEDFEAFPVGELHIHEDEVQGRVRGQVFHRGADGVGGLHHLNVGEVDFQQADELRLCHSLVFDDQGFHHRSGRVTV